MEYWSNGHITHYSPCIETNSIIPNYRILIPSIFFHRSNAPSLQFSCSFSFLPLQYFNTPVLVLFQHSITPILQHSFILHVGITQIVTDIPITNSLDSHRAAPYLRHFPGLPGLGFKPEQTPCLRRRCNFKSDLMDEGHNFFNKLRVGCSGLARCIINTVFKPNAHGRRPHTKGRCRQ